MDDPAPDDLPGDDPPTEADGPEPISTCCHGCGGAGWSPQPVLTLHHQYAHTSTYAKPCPWCADGRLTEIVPPV